MKRKEIESVEELWMNPEPVIQTELSQKKEKQTPYINTYIWNLKASLVAQMLKNPPAMQKISVRFLGWEDPLEKGMATHFSSTGESICRAAVEMKT